MKQTFLLICLGLAVVVCSSNFAASVETKPGTFSTRTVQVGNNKYPYVVYLPSEYDRSRKWPIILFLHGAGECGSDGWLQTEVGLGSAIRKNPERFKKMIGVFPQAPKETRWLDEPARSAIKALDQTVAEFHGDISRIYLTGISMGGYGAWYLAIKYPKRFAAVVPVCGGITPSATATSVRQLPITIGSDHPYAVAAQAMPHIPVWIFHGSADPVIPVTESRHMFDELKRLGANVRYTEYPGVDHNSWDQAYAESKLWTWLFAKHR